MKAELASASDYAVLGVPEPPVEACPVGYVIRDGVRVAAILTILRDEDGHVWACFDGSAPVPRCTHRLALMIREALTESGVGEVWADLDEGWPGARHWLQRLGFAPAGRFWRATLVGGR